MNSWGTAPLEHCHCPSCGGGGFTEPGVLPGFEAQAPIATGQYVIIIAGKAYPVIQAHLVWRTMPRELGGLGHNWPLRPRFDHYRLAVVQESD